jgi:arylsulfatase A-like enzyme
MKAIMVMFDSLNRHFLPPYGNDWVHAPNFQRLAGRTVTFEKAWVGSMPCIPARRELHTGRYNFLHAGWGPLEPFDDSMPEILKQSGVYTHLITDHQHYFEDGGATYHQRYSSWEFMRGQEGDHWKGQLADPYMPDELVRPTSPSEPEEVRHHWLNRQHAREEKDWPQARVFSAGLEFIDTNHSEDDWFLQIETFDPHEPYFAPKRFRDMYPHDYDGPHFDWPPYTEVTQEAAAVQHVRNEYAALLSMCDESLGKVLDAMDRHDMWDDTMLIVTTDHGFLLGEHGWWSKCIPPFYNEVARIPFFVWDPRSRRAGARSDALAQLIDVSATLLDYFGQELPPNMQGKPLAAAAAGSDETHRDYALFGVLGEHINITDGRYVYMLAPQAGKYQTVYNYSLMPMQMRMMLTLEELREAQLAEPFSFTKGAPTLRTPSLRWPHVEIPAEVKAAFPPMETMLFDLEKDPGQNAPFRDEAIEATLKERMAELMARNDAPLEQYGRMGLREPERG